MAADTLQIGNITVKNQGFGLVLSSSSDFLDISCDGLFVSLQIHLNIAGQCAVSSTLFAEEG